MNQRPSAGGSIVETATRTSASRARLQAIKPTEDGSGQGIETDVIESVR
jgi:hypothetical protein